MAVTKTQSIGHPHRCHTKASPLEKAVRHFTLKDLGVKFLRVRSAGQEMGNVSHSHNRTYGTKGFKTNTNNDK